MHRLMRSLDLDVPVNTGYVLNVEQWDGYPSAASFPMDNLGMPARIISGRARVMSCSSPELGDERESASSWQIMRDRLWKFVRGRRRR